MLDEFFKINFGLAHVGPLLRMEFFWPRNFPLKEKRGFFLNVMSSNGGFDARHTALWCSCSQRTPTRLMSQFGTGRSFAMLFHFENHRKTPLAAAVAAAVCWVYGPWAQRPKVC